MLEHTVTMMRGMMGIVRVTRRGRKKWKNKSRQGRGGGRGVLHEERVSKKGEGSDI